MQVFHNFSISSAYIFTNSSTRKYAIIKFQSFLNILAKCFKQKFASDIMSIVCAVHPVVEAYSEPCKTCKMVHFVKTVNGF